MTTVDDYIALCDEAISAIPPKSPSELEAISDEIKCAFNPFIAHISNYRIGVSAGHSLAARRSILRASTIRNSARLAVFPQVGRFFSCFFHRVQKFVFLAALAVNRHIWAHFRTDLANGSPIERRPATSRALHRIRILDGMGTQMKGGFHGRITSRGAGGS